MVVAALLLGVLIAQIAVAGGTESDQERIVRLERQVSALRAEVGGTAETAKKKKRKKAKASPGPAGPAGPTGSTGAQGAPGAPGSPAGGMLFGWVEPGDLPVGTSKDFSPLGSGDTGINVGSIPVSPNSTVVLRDLAVRVLTPPGLMARWDIILQGASTAQQLTCSIVSSAATTCNSGGQIATIPPGGNIRLIVADAGSLNATPSSLYYAYRVGGP